MGETADYDRVYEEVFALDSFGMYAHALPARGQDISKFPPFADLVKSHGQTSTRHQLEEAVIDRPRVKTLPELNRAYFSEFRMPVPMSRIMDRSVRRCRAGRECIFYVHGGHDKGYIAREFLLPHLKAMTARELATHQPDAGFCIDCLLCSVTDRHERALMLKYT